MFLIYAIIIALLVRDFLIIKKAIERFERLESARRFARLTLQAKPWST